MKVQSMQGKQLVILISTGVYEQLFIQQGRQLQPGWNSLRGS